jgi:DNA-directed RNA polymerase II subunit RPB1
MPAGFYTPSSEIEPIVGIQLCVFSPDEIEKRSVVEITNAGTYEGNEPKIGGLFDPRMGVIDNGKECRSCGQTNHKCPGHFGHFRLARPVYYIQFLPFILNILSCICIRCSKLRIDKNYRSHFLKRKGEVRWREVLAASKEIHRCGQETEDGCGALQPTRFVREGIARIMAEWDDDASGSRSGKQTQILEVEYVLRLFRKILDEDVDFIGMNRYWCRPDWMICTVLPIPPPQVRPSVIQDNNQRSEDDLTHKLAEIVKTNNTYLQPKIDANAAKSVIDEWTNVLQYHIATLVDNQIPGVAPSAQRNGRPLKSIQQRLGSKEGRIRYNIQGKRVEFSARSVITPDPNISIAELGVPEKIAMNLTRPERVTLFNRNKLYRLIQNGPLKYPGAKTIRRTDGRIISLRHVNTKEIVLNLGDIVNRHLMDNDPILFNRQPTLHRMSMMAHRVKVLTGKTFRLNVSVTAPYNADFDGDEMNAHAPQSIEAATELEEIAAVPHQILRPRDGLPVIGIVQDTLVGSYRLTRDSVQFNNREFMNMMMWNKRFTGVLPDPKRDALHWTGQQVISQLLPPINLDMMNGGKKKVVIREGDVLEGQFDKGIFSKASKGIIHMTYNDYGSKDTVQLIDSLQNTVAQFLIYDGFSVGISDLIADAATKKEMNSKIQEKKKQIETVLLEVHQDLFDNNTGKTNQSEFEDRAFGLLNKAMESAGEIGQNTLSTENRMIAMVRAGSKGGPINIAQMIACVGQQNIEGKRIPYGFEDRTLPHFKKYDDGAEARGFIENSFISGLTPTEFFFHAMSGREGLIDTAVKTADTGYIQRQIVKAMEDLVVQQDGTVRDANMNITQFQYGEDGINSTKIESQPLPLSTMTDDEIEKEFGLKGVDLSEVMGVPRGDDAVLLADYTKQVFADRKMIVEEIFRSGRQGSIYSPVNLERLILNIKIKFGLRPEQKTNLTPANILKGIESVLKKTQTYHAIWAALLRFYLSPTKLILQDRFTESAFDTLCEVLVTKNWQAWVQPGEHVGIIAAQSIGEPSTQMTLNSVDWDTSIMIAKNGQILCPQIGEFIDAHLAANPGKIQEFGNQQYLPLDDGNDWKAISCDENGKMMWTKLEAITRHPVVNEDGTNTILEVTLASGRIVKATKGLSFLTKDGDKVVGIKGSDLKVGDLTPIANSLVISELGYTETLVLREHLPATEWLYGTDVHLALAELGGTDRHWFQKNQGIKFSIPYSRSDAFREAFVDGKNTNAENILPGFVYPARTRPDVSQIPDTIPLTESFGFFVGAYLAEGMANTTQVNITNNDKAYLNKVSSLMNTWNVGTHTVCEQRKCEKTGISGTTTSLIIHSTLLASLMQKVFGRVSYDKTLPDWVFQAPDTFVQGLVDGYISGDGSVDKNSGNVKASSVSRDLLDRMRTLFARYGIFGSITEYMPEQRHFDSVSMHYTLYIPAYYSKVFAETFSLSTGYKQDILDYHYGMIGKGEKNLRQMTGDVIWDMIESIKEVTPIKGKVYDVTVEGTRNFMTSSCHIKRDTFHLAGVASKSNVTRGVPRLKELLKVTQNPKAVSLTIHLKPEYRNSKEKAREVAQDLELTLLRDMAVKTAIYYDPSDSNTVLKEDQDLLAFYKLFEISSSTSDTTVAAEDESVWSKWILRLELNREKMFDKNVTMEDILFVLRRLFDTNIRMVYSDFNSQKLVMRIRLTLKSMDDGKSDPSSLDALAAYKKFQNKLLNSVIIRGFPGIKAVTFRKGDERFVFDEKEKKYVANEEYILDTDGSNFIEAMNHPAVDGSRLYSTHVHDVLGHLGIEATRQILYNEIQTLFEDGQINYRHLGLLVDAMTRAGRLMSVDRYGINKLDIGPLAKASFEETERILLKAAVFGEIDPITGVSANIMTGQPMRGGTTFTDILLDEGAFMSLQKNMPEPPVIEKDEDARMAMETSEKDEDDLCSPSRLKMNMTLPSKGKLLDEDDIDFAEVEDDGEV